jgi:hypothetical protein
MAEMTVPQFRRRLEEILTEGLHAAGIRATIELEPVHGTKLTRVYVVSRQRDKLSPTDWDALLWRLIQEEFGNEANTRITTIYTLTPAELKAYRANVEAEAVGRD